MRYSRKVNDRQNDSTVYFKELVGHESHEVIISLFVEMVKS